jgi:DNA primase
VDAPEEIKSRLSIEDVVQRYVDLKRSGSSYKGLCPFHGEKTPSFYVTPSRGMYKCFGCGKSGDIFTFVEEIERVDFPEALRRLAEQAGVQLPDRTERTPSLKKRLYEANEAAAAFFSEILGSSQGERTRSYLRERAFEPHVFQPFALGYAPAGRDHLYDRLHAAGFEDRLLVSAGLIFQDDVKEKPRDRFRARLMFPIRDSSGRVLGFGGRTLTDEQPKYLNSPQTEVFDKSSVLYGIQLASAGIRESKSTVLVEGYLDAIRAHASGFTNVVASLGTSVTVAQLSALSRMTNTVILALDPDPAGQAAAARTAIAALAELTRTRGRQPGEAGTVELRIAKLPSDGGDPDELIREHPEEWRRALGESVPAFDFFFEATVESLDRSQDSWRQSAIDRLLPLIRQFSTSAGWQAGWLERLSRETGVDPSLLQRSMSGQPARPRQTRLQDKGPNQVAETTSRGLTADSVDIVERALLALLLKLVVVPRSAAEELRSVQLRRGAYREILGALLLWSQKGNYDFDMFCEKLTEPLQQLARELRDDPSPLPADDKLSVAIGFHLARARLLAIREEQRTVQSMLAEIGEEDRGAAVSSMAELLHETFELERSLERLGQEMVARAAGA